MTPFSPKSLLPLGAAAVALFAVFVAALTVQLAPQLRTQVQTPAAPLAALPPPGEAPSLPEAPPPAAEPPAAPEAAPPAAPGAPETPGEQPPVPAPAAVPVPPPPPASASSPALSPPPAGGKEISSRQPQPAAVTKSSCGDGVCAADEEGGDCTADCPVCGDGECTGDEDRSSCAKDCSGNDVCGNDECETEEKNSGSCPKDCGGEGETSCDLDGFCDANEKHGVCDDCPAIVALEEEVSVPPEEETTGQLPGVFSVLAAPFKLAWETFRFSLFAVVSFFGGGEEKTEPVTELSEPVGEATLPLLSTAAGLPPPPRGIHFPVCGNGTQELGEQCDDGNTTDGDGCSASCQKEEAPPPLPPPGVTPVFVCGNGVQEPWEQCDDGNTVSGDGCDSSCLFEPNTTPLPSFCHENKCGECGSGLFNFNGCDAVECQNLGPACTPDPAADPPCVVDKDKCIDIPVFVATAGALGGVTSTSLVGRVLEQAQMAMKACIANAMKHNKLVPGTPGWNIVLKYCENLYQQILCKGLDALLESPQIPKGGKIAEGILAAKVAAGCK